MSSVETVYTPLVTLRACRNAGQFWYDYTGTTGHDVLAFKLFDCRKTEPFALRPYFHGLSPTRPRQMTPPQSCGLRVGVFIQNG
jgi:hypothetical protein